MNPPSASNPSTSWWHLAGAAAAGAALALSLAALTRQSSPYAAAAPASASESRQAGTEHSTAIDADSDSHKQPGSDTSTPEKQQVAAAPSTQPAKANASESATATNGVTPHKVPQQSSPSRQGSGEVLGFKPIGYLQTCFTTRNGTPRQPLLVKSARARLVLSGDLPRACLEGLTQWSHVWVLYVFHENADSPNKVSYADWSALKAKVHVPRLNGAKQGLFATRTPHRPCPIGLSVAEVIAVEGNTLVLGGADIVDGSPILDIKPYVPFCDSVPQALAPPYVTAEMEEEPLAVGKVLVTVTGVRQLVQAWTRNRHRSLYDSAAGYVALVCEILSRDIRALRQRLHDGEAAQQRNNASSASAAQVLATHGLLSVEEAVAYAMASGSKQTGLPQQQQQQQQQQASAESSSGTNNSSSSNSAAATKKNKKKKKQGSGSGNHHEGAAHGEVHEQQAEEEEEGNNQTPKPSGTAANGDKGPQQPPPAAASSAGGPSHGPSQKEQGGPQQQQSSQQPQGGAEEQEQQPQEQEEGTGVFHVVIEGVDVSYDVGPTAVIIGGASLRTALAQQHAHKHKGR